MTLEETLFKFLEEFYDRQRPVLLGLSGGSDSLALLYLLQEYKKKNPLSFGLAHVDHGWRVESADEAEKLQLLAAEMALPFHQKKLNPGSLFGNMEQACRYERLAFFTHLCQEFGYQAVILGHHADDQSETVLKKILEGSSLPYLAGMSIISQIKGLTIWRPLLKCSKSLIQNWLNAKGYIPFEDKTNRDKKFLRGRFRTTIIPEISKEFGKEIGSGLCRISQEAEELKAYLDEQLKVPINSILTGPFGSCLDLENQYIKFVFEIKYLIRKVCEREGIRLSNAILDEACRILKEKLPNRSLFSKGVFIQIDRGRLFVMKRSLSDFSPILPVQLGQYSVAGWTLHVKEVDSLELTYSGWKDAWKGCMIVHIPQGNYILKKGDSSFSKRWTDAKVPAFMRWVFPVLFSEKKIVKDFLTKRGHSTIESKSGKYWQVRVTCE